MRRSGTLRRTGAVEQVIQEIINNHFDKLDKGKPVGIKIEVKSNKVTSTSKTYNDYKLEIEK